MTGWTLLDGVWTRDFGKGVEGRVGQLDGQFWAHVVQDGVIIHSTQDVVGPQPTRSAAQEWAERTARRGP